MVRHRKFPRHFVVKASGFYYQATPAMRAAGIASESLGTDMTAAKMRADTLNAAWGAIRRGEEPIGKTPALPGTFGHLVERLRASNESPSTITTTSASSPFTSKVLPTARFGSVRPKNRCCSRTLMAASVKSSLPEPSHISSARLQARNTTGR